MNLIYKHPSYKRELTLLGKLVNKFYITRVLYIKWCKLEFITWSYHIDKLVTNIFSSKGKEKLLQHYVSEYFAEKGITNYTAKDVLDHNWTIGKIGCSVFRI